MTERITEDNKAADVFSGNLVPSEWYKTITTKSGSPDAIAIMVLSEIFYRWRVNGGEWQTSYEHFYNKLHLSHDRTRRALVRLENLGIIKRELRDTTLKSGFKCRNVLFIKLNEDFLAQYKSDHIQPDEKEEIRTRPAILRIRPADLRTRHRKNATCYNASIPYSTSSGRQFGDNIDIDKDLNKIINKEYSYSRAEFFVDKSEELKHGKTETFRMESTAECSEPDLPYPSPLKPSAPQRLNEIIAGILDSVTPVPTSKADDALPPSSSSNKKTIAQFEITDTDAEELRFSSGRDFSNNFIRELKNKLAYKYPDKSFYNKGIFLKYMAKILKAELHDAVKTAHNSFRLKCNIDPP